MIMATTFFQDDSIHEDHKNASAMMAAESSEPVAGQDQASKDHDATSPGREGSTDGLVGDEKTASKLTLWQKVKLHYRRYWMWHLLAIIIILAILLPILFKVIIPAIVQNIVSGQRLPIYGGSFQAMSSEKLQVSLNTSLWSPLAVEKDAGPLCLYNKDTVPWSPFFNLTLGQQGIDKESPAVVNNDTVAVNNEMELIKWLGRFYDEETVDLSIRSWPTIRVGAIPTYNYLDKTIQMKGLRGLMGADVKGLNITLPPPQSGNNLNGTIVIPNWSSIFVNLGDLNLDLYSGKIRLGNVAVNDVQLTPGNNTKVFVGRLNLDQLGPNLGPILASQAEPLGRGVIELNATATSVMTDGGHISFMEKVLGSKTIPLDISVITLLSDVISGLMHGNNKSLVDVLGDVLGNKTFVQDVLNNFNSTNVSMDGTSIASRVKARRSSSQGSMAWNLLKIGMKMRSTGLF